MILRLVVVLGVSVTLVGCAAAYVHGKAARLLRLGPRGRGALALVLAAGIAATLAARLLERTFPATTLAPPGMAGWVITVATVIATLLLGLVDLASLAARRLRPRPVLATPPPEPEAARPSLDPAAGPSPRAPASRRVFLSQAATGSALAIGAASATYGALFGRRDYTLEEVSFAIPGLSRRLDGYTLVQLSDLHLGTFVGEAEMRAAEALVARARPDLIVLTGDLIDHDSRQANKLGRFVQRLMALARDGVIAVPGNHDYYTGIDMVVTVLERAGAQVLRNGGRVIGDQGAGFALLGVDDPAGPQEDERAVGPDLGAALAALPASADLPRVLLCHNPAYFPQAAGKVALQLSGHTHGGQINLGVSPAKLVLRHGLVAGRYAREGSGLYVNRGFGTVGPPVRLGAPPEVTRIVLTV